MVGLGTISTFMAPPVLAGAAPSVMSVVNPIAGSKNAPEVAGNVFNVARTAGIHMLPPFETLKDSRATIQVITRRIGYFRQKNPKSPLDVIAYGGDWTVNIVIAGVLHYIFPKQDDLITQSAEQVREGMLASGIRVGIHAQGSTNDLGLLTGAPRGNVAQAIEFLKEAISVPLNLGLLEFLDTGERVIFSHNAIAGTVIAEVFKETPDEHGRLADWKRRAKGFDKIMLRPDPFDVRWGLSNGKLHYGSFREVIIHGTPLADGANGFPGAPRNGLGAKLFPHLSRWKLFRLFSEFQRRGRAFMKGQTEVLAQDERLSRMAAELQPQLAVGEAITCHFFEAAKKRKPREVSVQVYGDYLRDAHAIRVRALPSWPFMMMMPASPLHRLFMHNRASTLQT